MPGGDESAAITRQNQENRMHGGSPWSLSGLLRKRGAPVVAVVLMGCARWS